MGIPAAVIGAVGGSVISGLFGQSSADAQMAFQKEVLQNQIQWKVADLKKAGLNPILATGMNTAVPSGASAQMPDLGASVARGIATAKENEQIDQAMRIARDKQQAEMDLLRAQEYALRAQGDESYKKINTGLYESQVLGQKALAELHQSNVKLNTSTIEKQMADVQVSMRQLAVMANQIQLLQSQKANVDSSTGVNEKQRELLEVERRFSIEKAKTEKILQEIKTAEAQASRAGLARKNIEKGFHESFLGKWVVQAGLIVDNLKPW